MNCGKPMQSKVLSERHCKPCEGGVEALTPDQVSEELAKVPGWSVSADTKTIHRYFHLSGFSEVMAFVNALAAMADREGHHPDVHFGYNYCKVEFTTHAINGLSENDFICAAKVNQLME